MCLLESTGERREKVKCERIKVYCHDLEEIQEISLAEEDARDARKQGKR